MAIIYGHPNHAIVYWVHHKHMNPWQEGYVGVSKNPLQREQEHMRKLLRNKHDNVKLQRAFNKNSAVETHVLYYGPIAECYEIEAAYRFRPQIGWNIEAGGQRNNGEGGRKNKGRIRADVSKRNYETNLFRWWAGKKRTDKDKAAKQRAALKTVENGTHPSKQLLTCPHCKLTTGTGNAKRWHFDNCKEKVCAVS